MSVTVTVSRHQAVDLLHSILHPWEIKGGAFFNDYATMPLFIDGEKSPHYLILRRDGTWEFKAEVTL